MNMATTQYLNGVRDAQGNLVPVPANPNAVWKMADDTITRWQPSPTQAAANVTKNLAQNTNPAQQPGVL